MLTIHVWPKRLKEFLLTHPLYKSPTAARGETPAKGGKPSAAGCRQASLGESAAFGFGQLRCPRLAQPPSNPAPTLLHPPRPIRPRGINSRKANPNSTAAMSKTRRGGVASAPCGMPRTLSRLVGPDLERERELKRLADLRPAVVARDVHLQGGVRIRAFSGTVASGR